MLKPHVYRSTYITTLFPFSKPFLHGNNHAFGQVLSSPSLRNGPKIQVGSAPSNSIIKAISVSTKKSIKVKAVITVKPTLGTSVSIVDDLEDMFGKTFSLEIVSAELDPITGIEKSSINGHTRKKGDDKDGNVVYESEFDVPIDFGEVGAVYVQNDHSMEIFLKDIVLDRSTTGGDPVNITCNSWIQPKKTNEQGRIFFTDKSFLPSKTPDGLKRLRYEELQHLRGDGYGTRQPSDRIYDYDVYNDLGNPDKNLKLKRPVLGGKKFPYPRRCRTGRPRCESDPLSEKRDDSVYVPRDEAFSDVKQGTFYGKALYSVIHSVVPSVEAIFDGDKKFEYFTEIDQLFNEDGFSITDPLKKPNFMNLLPRLIKIIKETGEEVLQFETPEALYRDKFFWFRDEEFSRQTLAGLNPCSIQLITEWPLKSSLDPAIYGPQTSAITTEIIEKEIGGMITVEEAIKQKKLFMLDYHDLLLPYVEKVRELKRTTLYGSRTIFFLNSDETLRPLAIELTRPKMNGKPHWRNVYTPSWNSTECWLWRLAKAHVLAHDSGYHQLVSHWLRTHCAVEPYIIASNRQLSVMHPIYKLLHPHFRYTMEINSLARQQLINAGGIIEGAFSPGKYSMEFSAVAYEKQWRFDYQALPKDLISRGMAVEDPSAPHGIKLTIEDYPFAKDGLDVWDTIKQWVTDYVNHYYPDQSLVESDEELHNWWTEIRTVGHGDKKDEAWWPILKTPQDLIEIITTIVWVASGHHAAVNFGQYTYAGYFPNRPTIARVNMPDEDKSQEIWKVFNEKPEHALLYTFPNQEQAVTVMTTLDVLSSHSPDEEYLGKDMEPAWGEDPLIKAAFEKFSGRLMELEGTFDERNADINSKNRNGAGVVPYHLLKPFWKDGDKYKGIPYSISI